MEFLFGVVSGAFMAFAVIGLAASNSDDKMCSGKVVVIERADTVRTFSCHVELKRKDEK